MTVSFRWDDVNKVVEIRRCEHHRPNLFFRGHTWVPSMVYFQCVECLSESNRHIMRSGERVLG